MRIVPAFDIDDVTAAAVSEAIERIPYFDLSTPQGVKKLLAHAIFAVHGAAARLFNGDVRDQLVFYYGRSSDEPSNVIGRWRSRGHRYSILLGRVKTCDVRAAESDGIRIMRLLSDRDALCIKKFENVSLGSNGPLPSSPYSVLYLTWYFSSPGDIGRIPPSEISEVASELQDDFINELSVRSIREILEITRRHSQMAPVRWYA
jgi:hypothetical protein